MKFSCCLGNPPYHGTSGIGHTIYENFTSHFSNTAELTSMVHPPGWRRPRPGNSEMRELKSIMWERCKFLSIHGLNDHFNVETRYDYFLLGEDFEDQLTVIDEKGKDHLITKSEWPFIPNHSFNLVQSLLGNGTGVIRTSDYHSTSKNHVSSQKSKTYCYPIIHSITQSKIRYLWSSKNNLGHFGVPKVVFSDAAPIDRVIVDVNGEYGMSEHAIGIPIESKLEGKLVEKALLDFDDVIEATSWSNFQIDWRIFRHFREDWYESILEKQ